MQSLDTLLTSIDTYTGFDHWGPDANPLIRLIKRRARRLSLRQALWLAFGIGLAGAAYTSWQLLTTTENMLHLSDWSALLMGWTIYILAPMIASLWGVQHTRRTQQSAYFDMLYLTPLPNYQLIEAFAFETIYTMRYILLVMAAIMPAMIIKTLHALLILDIEVRVHYSYTAFNLTVDPPSQTIMVIFTLYALVIAVNLWGLTFCGVVLGVRAALLRTQRSLALFTVPSMILSVVLCPFILGSVPVTLITSLPCCGSSLVALVPLIMVIAPYLLAINTVIQTAGRWRR